MVTLQNKYLTVTFNSEGAEIQSVKDNKTDYEYIWTGNPEYWGRRAPVLFPIVGRLKNNRYEYKDKFYNMTQHGFARDMTFVNQMVTDNSVSFNLKSNEETLRLYPFEFSLQITYVLYKNQLTVSYEIYNPSKDEPLYYSIGGHPGFNVSLSQNYYGSEDFDRVYLELEPAGKFLQIPLTEEGLIKLDKAHYVSIQKERLTHKMFRKDALIYQIGQSNNARLIDEANGVQISIRPSNMSFIGVWSPVDKLAPFICIEPWAGIADDYQASGRLNEKYAIQQAEPSEIQTHDYTLQFERL